MGLSRLDNFIKNVRGNILYVDIDAIDATDSIENKGNSLTRPFKTIQRALIEAARFSYQRGLNNDRFNQTTIVVFPGDHVVDNRPGFIPDGPGNFRLRLGTTTNDFSAWDLTTVYDLNNPNNALYKLNSIHGGVIIPRGTSIVGYDLRKTRIRPTYVPNPANDNIPRSAIFRITGGCYFENFTVLDADPNDECYLDYTLNEFRADFSHNKLTAFEFADGTNSVQINDSFQTYGSTRTDLDMYYEKVGLAYGSASGRQIEPDYPSDSIDIQPKIDEFRIVGPSGLSVGISSIRAGTGLVSSKVITVTTSSAITGLDVDTPITVRGLSVEGYNGKFVVTGKTSATQFTYEVQNAPLNPLPSITGSTVSLTPDSITSASPYINGVSVRSVYGLCGLLADGSKSSGFKSMVIAQFTGIGLQKDENAFIKYNNVTGVYDDSTISGNEALSADANAVYKPSYSNFHIKAANNSYIQAVSCFAVGFAEQFVSETGGDITLVGSNSNFGSKALVSSGFKNSAFSQDDLGYITHVIPPQELPISTNTIEFLSLDLETTVGVGTTNERLYLNNEKNVDSVPQHIVSGYRVGAKIDDELYVLTADGASSTEHRARIVMPNSQSSSEKVFTVNRSPAGINSITSSVITLTQAHTFENGETVRVLSDTGRLPDGIESNKIYYVITDSNASSGLTTNVTIKLATTPTDAERGTAATINNYGGILKIVSRVSDKKSGDVGHPIQYDTLAGQWYIKVSTASTDNQIYPRVVVGLGTTALGKVSPRTYIKRKSDTRLADDTIYRLRYVIPASSGGSTAVPPLEGYVIQETNTGIGATTTEIQTYFGTGSLTNVNQQRNFNLISNARWIESQSEARILSDLPHHLSQGSLVELVNIRSGVNTTGVGNSGFNRIYTVTGITSAREFAIGLNTNPGSFTSDLLTRSTTLPYFKRTQYNTTYFVQKTEEIQPYVNGTQDGIYYLTVLNSSNSPTISPFTEDKFAQPLSNLYPQSDKDTPEANPDSATSFATSNPIGEVLVDNVKSSITRENLNQFISDVNIGVGAGLTDIVTSVGGTIHLFKTRVEHGLNGITQVSIASSGSGYGTGVQADYYSAKLVSIGASTTGAHATAKVTVAASGGISEIIIMNSGSAYGIGNTMHVVGIATTTGHTPAVVTVQKIYDNVGDTFQVTGVSSASHSKYNTLYRITEVRVGAANTFVATSIQAVTGVSTAGIETSKLLKASAHLTGAAIGISSITFDPTSGIATVHCRNRHGLKPNTKINIFTGITTMPVFTGDFIVRQGIGLTSFKMEVGIGATTSRVATGSSMFALRNGFSSNDGDIIPTNESLNGRMTAIYAGITTTLSAAIADASTSSMSLTDVDDIGINIGDYFMIDDEIVRIKTTPTNPATNPLTIFRGVFGTKAAPHEVNSIVRRIRPLPIEFRRASAIKAEGHTWEHVGFGPGNYSTALPTNQTRARSNKEQTLARSVRKNGGSSFFTGIDEQGYSYAAQTKSSSLTGETRTFDGPVRTITGEDISKKDNLSLIKSTEGTFTRSIRVDGGDDGKVVSEFAGPVVFNEKITSSSRDGIEVKSISLEGDTALSRKYTVGIATPTDAGIPGDVVYYDKPEQGKYIGWVYTVDKQWRRFGNISLSGVSNIQIFDRVGVGTTALADSSTSNVTFQVGSGTSIVTVTSEGVGIGTTWANGRRLRVNGSADISGDVSVGGTITGSFSGDGSKITNLNIDQLSWAQVTGAGNTGIYNVSMSRVGIGTSVPSVTLEVGVRNTSAVGFMVNNRSVFVGIISASNGIVVSGALTATSYRLEDPNASITAGFVTCVGQLSVGSTSSFSGGMRGLGGAELERLKVAGISTLGVATVGQLNVSGISTLAFANVGQLNASGISTLAFTNLGQLSVSGITTLSGGVNASQGVDAARLRVSGIATFGSDVTISGNLTVDGTTTTINSTTLTVDDKNIELASTTSPTDAAADGGGITLRGTTNKTLNWVDATDSWTSSENIDLATTKTYKIANTDVLSSTTLGSGVINSSLTSVGNLQNLNVSGVTTSNSYTINGTTVIDSARQLQNIASLDATTTATIESAVAAAPNTSTDLRVTGIATLNQTTTVGLRNVGVATLGFATATTLNVTGFSTFGAVSATLLTTSGITTLSDTSAVTLSVAGVSTLTGGVSAPEGMEIGRLSVVGVTTITGGILADQGIDAERLQVSGITTLSQTTTAGLVNAGLSTLGNVTSETLSVSGVSTFISNVNAPEGIEAGRLNVTGIATFVEGIEASRLSVSGVSTFSNPVFADQGINPSRIRVTGISTLAQTTTEGLVNSGISTLGNATATTLNISGFTTTHATSIQLLNVTGISTFGSDVTITGDLTVNGTTTTINSVNLSVDDKHIELGATASPTDASADGGGLTLKGTTDKSLYWVSATSSWTSSENFDLAATKTFKISGTDVLSSTTLGSGIVNSSLTSVGTLGGLTVSGAANITGTAQIGALNVTGITSVTQLNASGLSNTGISTLTSVTATSLNVSGIVTATSYNGNGSTLTGIPGIGTALSTTTTSPLNKIYFTNNTLNITETITVDVPNTASLSADGFRVAYTNYAEVVVEDTFDLIISDGDEFALDVLALT